MGGMQESREPRPNRWDPMSLSKRSFDWQSALATFLRIACGLILVYASQDKIGYAEKFTGIIKEYHILPKALVPLAAAVIPWLEFFTGICLAVGFKWRGAPLLFFRLMGVFFLALCWYLAPWGGM